MVLTGNSLALFRLNHCTIFLLIALFVGILFPHPLDIERPRSAERIWQHRNSGNGYLLQFHLLLNGQRVRHGEVRGVRAAPPGYGWYWMGSPSSGPRCLPHSISCEPVQWPVRRGSGMARSFITVQCGSCWRFCADLQPRSFLPAGECTCTPLNG